MSRTNKLYNYLVNTYGLSKELILIVVDNRISDLLNKHISSKLDSNHVNKVVVNEVANILTKGFENNHFSKTAIEDYIKNIIAVQIEEKMNDEYELNVKVVRKNKSVLTGGNPKVDLKENK